jgi:hypothetical protein
MQPNSCTLLKIKEDMSAPRGNDRHNSQEPRWQNTLSPEILDILGPALQVGGLSGGSSFVSFFSSPTTSRRQWLSISRVNSHVI